MIVWRLLPKPLLWPTTIQTPFNPTTTIKFEVTVASKVNVVVFNALGQKVKTLFDGNAAVGVNEVVWNGTNDFGSAVASGVYYYQMRVEGKVFTKKMTLIK
jgi:flagellar hook assembly protein FlgD